MLVIALAHFGPDGPGSQLSPGVGRIVDMITAILIIIALGMLMQKVYNRDRN